MAKNRTLNEIRQSKEYQQAVKSGAIINTQYKSYTNSNTAVKSGNNIDFAMIAIDQVDVAIDEIVDSLTTHMFDIIFEAVNDEMHKYTVFQEQTYLTEAGIDMFEEQWFEFYHEHHGDILHQVMKNITN